VAIVLWLDTLSFGVLHGLFVFGERFTKKHTTFSTTTTTITKRLRFVVAAVAIVVLSFQNKLLMKIQNVISQG
jgi:phosphoglycerol transferase MdoB-like AlkP superfamily enzyme